MKISLQWLAFPVFGYSIVCLFLAIDCIPDILWGKEIMPLIALGIFIIKMTHCLASTVLGGLVYFAFRNTNITFSE